MAPAGTALPNAAVAADEPVEDDSDITGAVRVSAAGRRAAGVRLEMAEEGPISTTVRVLGRVAADETRIYRINASVDGWIQKAYPITVGSLVKKGETLATFYAPQLLDIQQSYIYAVTGTADRLQSADRQQAVRRQDPEQAQAAQLNLSTLNLQRQMDLLRGMGMSDAQIDEIGQMKTPTQEVRIVAPAKGFITLRVVSPGQRFLKGTELFQVTDLSRVWILADVFEHEARWFRPGAKAVAQHPYTGQLLKAAVSNVLPVFDPVSRTLKIRLEVDNPDFSLRPEMFLDVELPAEQPRVLTVSADAVLHSGPRKTVFVERAEGVYEPRRVVVGRRWGDRVEIHSGLSAGEPVVVSGAFLIDSESRLQAAAQGIFGTAGTDPACGDEVDELKARSQGNTSTHRGTTYFFTSLDCKQRFDQNPDAYVATTAGKAATGDRTRLPGTAHDHAHN